MQLVAHAVPPALHRFGAQLVVAGLGVMQLPVPLQVSANVSVVPAHVCAWHMVPLVYSMHAPAPLQPMPSAPHDAAPCAEQLLCGSSPDLTEPHTPSDPCPLAAALHASHVPLHAELQQTPSAQDRPDAQSLFWLQCLPCAQRVAHAATGPPQSTSVSIPFCAPLQLTIPPQPSAKVPHVMLSIAHVNASQPQLGALHTPFMGGWHCTAIVQPLHRPVLHERPLPPQAFPSGS